LWFRLYISLISKGHGGRCDCFRLLHFLFRLAGWGLGLKNI